MCTGGDLPQFSRNFNYLLCLTFNMILVVLVITSTKTSTYADLESNSTNMLTGITNNSTYRKLFEISSHYFGTQKRHTHTQREIYI